MNYRFANGATAANTSIGDLSAAIITEIANATAGDIFTIVVAASSLSPDQRVGTTEPTWQIIQFILDTTNTDTLESKGISLQGLYPCIDTEGVASCAMGAAILSRQTPDGLLVSETIVRPSIATAYITDWLKGEFARQQAAVSWGGNPDAILAGGELPNITGVSSNNVATVAWGYGMYTGSLDAGGDLNIDSIIVTGSNLKTAAQGGKWKVRMYLDSGMPMASDNPISEVSASSSGTPETITLSFRSMSLTMQQVTQEYIVLYYNDVPFAYGVLVIS